MARVEIDPVFQKAWNGMHYSRDYIGSDRMNVAFNSWLRVTIFFDNGGYLRSNPDPAYILFEDIQLELYSSINKIDRKLTMGGYSICNIVHNGKYVDFNDNFIENKIIGSIDCQLYIDSMHDIIKTMSLPFNIDR